MRYVNSFDFTEREQWLLQKGLNIFSTAGSCEVWQKNALQPLQNQKGQLPMVQNSYPSILDTNDVINFIGKQI